MSDARVPTRSIGRETVTGLLDDAVKATPEKTFLITEGEAYSYREMAARSGSASAALASAGVRRGDRIVAALPNSAEFLFLFIGAARLGAALAPVSPTCTTSELTGVVRQTKPKVVVLDGVAPKLQQAMASAGEPDVRVEDVYSFCVGGGTAPPIAAEPDDIVALISTSGSTRAPKLVAHRHSSVVLAAEGFPAWLGLDTSDRLLTALPLFHANALIYSTLGAMAAGASLALLKTFSARRFWQQTRELEATQFNLMGNMGEILMSGPVQPTDEDNPVRICYSGWAPLEARHRAFERRFHLDMVIGYGLSESLYGTVWPLDEPKPFGSIGRLRQHPVLGRINEARVVDEHGHPVGVGEAGELLLRNPATMSCYFGMRAETKTVLRDGWLYTGDIVRVDAAGLFYFIGRSKDIIRRSGENFAPIELEEAINQHPAVQMTAVVPVPSTMSEDDAKAFVVLETGAETTAYEILEACCERVAPFKLPRYLEFVESFPMTPTGRIAKGRLSRERNSSEHDLEAFRKSVTSGSV